jgi:hypothetical protein
MLDLTKLSEDELIDLNRRIVARLRLIRSARHLTQLARFAVGMTVEFDTDDGRTVSGTVARVNQRTATIRRPIGALASESLAAARPARCSAKGSRCSLTRHAAPRSRVTGQLVNR